MTTSNEDNDKTVIARPSRAAAAANKNPDVLPIGTRLSEFEIISLIGVGGFGIVYLAHDHSLNRRVALKEYMPRSLAVRGRGLEVTMRTANDGETFQAGLRSFVNEARLLAQFDHPSLVKVYRFWEDNGTAYMVMPYYVGRTLKELLGTQATPPDETWLRRLIFSLLDALEILHAVNVYHRDIAPDNIILLEGGNPVLLDFGAARHVISDSKEAPTVILKPSYAPAEQYANSPDMKQGAWTDLYALAAVIYYSVTGQTLPSPLGRLINDSLIPLEQRAKGHYSPQFLKAIDQALAVRPEGRPQSVAEFRACLGTTASESTSNARATTPVSEPTPRSRRRLVLAGVAAAALVAAGGVAWTLQKSSPVPAASSAPASGAPVSGAPASVAAVQTPPAPATPPATFDFIAEMDRIFTQRDPEHAVGVVVPSPRVTIGKDRLRFNVRSSRSGYLYVLMAGSDKQHLYLLFPNQIDRDNRVTAGKEVMLPRPGWSMVADGPAGTDQFVVIVSERERDFTKAGLVQFEPFAEFPFETAARLSQRSPADRSLFVGDPVCVDAAASCSDAYGAAAFSIEEVLR